jgi:hypothetical protein
MRRFRDRGRKPSVSSSCDHRAMKGARRVVGGTHNGDYTFTAQTNLRGIVTGNAIVTKGIRLEVHGTCEGDLVIEAGASADVFGIVGGTVRVRPGGQVNIHGSIGALDDPEKAAVLHPTAKVG